MLGEGSLCRVMVSRRSPTKSHQTRFSIDQLATPYRKTNLIYSKIPFTTCKLPLREMFLYFCAFTFKKIKQNLLGFFASTLPTLGRKEQVGGVLTQFVPNPFSRSGCDLWLILFFIFIYLHILQTFLTVTFSPSRSVNHHDDSSSIPFSFWRELELGFCSP